MDDLAPVIRPAIAEESAAAARLFDQVVADPGKGRDSMFGERLKTFVKARTPLVINQLDGKSQGERFESNVR